MATACLRRPEPHGHTGPYAANIADTPAERSGHTWPRGTFGIRSPMPDGEVTMNEPAPLLDRSEAALRLHVSQRSIRRYATLGLLDEIQVGPKLKKVTAASVDRLLADGQRSARAGTAA